jgi:hypothetical protein
LGLRGSSLIVTEVNRIYESTASACRSYDDTGSHRVALAGSRKAATRLAAVASRAQLKQATCICMSLALPSKMPIVGNFASRAPGRRRRPVQRGQWLRVTVDDVTW